MKLLFTERLNETENVFIFSRKIKGIERGVMVTVNMVYYEGKNELRWLYNDSKIREVIELLQGFKGDKDVKQD